MYDTDLNQDAYNVI